MYQRLSGVFPAVLFTWAPDSHQLHILILPRKLPRGGLCQGIQTQRIEMVCTRS
ncbi:hypothetical protein RSAG8_02271, partial [Rhizoctonia solani AG-8 WAC10335]